jgi:hypothetical protein
VYLAVENIWVGNIGIEKLELKQWRLIKKIYDYLQHK